MKILFSSHLFAPSIGGIETVGGLLAGEFHRAGHRVHVVTQTPAGGGVAPLPYALTRQPGPRQLRQLVRWCDVCVHNNLSLRTAWPLWFTRRPWVVIHQTWISRPDGTMAWQDRLKHRVLRRAHNLAISSALAAALPVASRVISNPYREELFRETADGPRERELMFLGRLVSDKGADLLIDALAMLRSQGLRPRLTVTGDGPDRPLLQARVAAAELTDQVEFTGALQGPALVALLNRHQVLVVPSRWAEPFGIVALEGIACGCVVVGSERGGLSAAIGPCGLTFPNGDTPALTARLAELLTSPARRGELRAGAKAHLERHRPAVVARHILEVLQTVVPETGSGKQG